MVFSSLEFIFLFLPAFLAVYALAPKKHKNAVIFLGSVIFYSFGVADSVYVGLFLMTILVNFILGQFIGAYPKNGRIWLVIGIIFNFWWLVFFKYSGFILTNVNDLTGGSLTVKNIILPIGISFYTFQNVSYIIDVYRGDAKPEKNFINYGAYITMFPQLIAGPIVKYIDIESQLSYRETNPEKFGQGATRFMLGLGKKVLLANNLGALHQLVLNLPDSQASVLSFWIGALAYTLQIYFDFSGYSDMAIGLGRMFGFEFLENFNYPYISRSVTEFWRRWHMSLSGWFRDYLYIPLGGNRVTVPRHILNLLIVWALTGLWHGASWNFVFWGLYYGVVLILEKYVFGSALKQSPAWAQHLYAMLVVLIGWVFFFSSDLSAAVHYLGVMFGVGRFAFANVKTLYLLRTNLILLILSCVLSGPRPMERFRRFAEDRRVAAVICIFAVFILSVAYLVYSSYNPFLYFRF